MNFHDFIGLDDLCRRLAQDVNGGHVHAYLFVGPEGTGKREMAGICARALNCAGAQKPCGDCGPCVRALSGSHPDILRVERQKSVGVDEIRALVARVMMKPYEGGLHAAIIEDAAAMTPQAQNALLKTLENPPQSCVFFLVAESTSMLLPTVVSRCRIMRFHEIGIEDCARALERHGIKPEEARVLADLSGGAVGVALRMHGDKAFWGLRERAIKALSALRERADISGSVALLKDDKDDAEPILAIMEQIARSLIRAQEGLESVRPELQTIRLDGGGLLLAAISARRRVSSHVIWQNNLETMFFELVS